MKRFFKWLGAILLGLSLLIGSFVAHEWYAEKPLSFRIFLDRTLIKFSLETPEMLTSLGILDSVGITAHNGQLDDLSLTHDKEKNHYIGQVVQVLNSYDNSNLDEQEQLTKEVAQYWLSQMIADPELHYHDYPVNQLFGVQNNFPTFMETRHQVKDEQGALYYIARLEAVELKFNQLLEGLEFRENKGIIPPKFVIKRVLDEMRGFVETPAHENILYTSLEQRVMALEDISAERKARLLNDAKNKITQSVYPAYTVLIDYFVALNIKATDTVGFWSLPNGDKAYKRALEIYTTTDMEPDEIHRLGLSEVTRIKAQMLSILQSQGYDTSAGFSKAMEALKADPQHYYEDSDEGRAQILADYKDIVDEIDAGLSKVFNVRTDVPIEVVRIPEFKEQTSPSAYYQQASMDGSRPGRFSVNLYDIKATPKYGMRTLAYHEGIPGHHFQLSIAQELEGMPMIRRMSPFSSYSEGWALYTEQLAWELGFQDEPLDNLGRLQAEIFRAVRLVVDTGIHAKQWTREQAITYMLENTGKAYSDVVAEVERYIVNPAQACSYKVGMIKILALREKAKTALGDKFELAEFHDAVLKNGAVPLTILEKIIDNYIAEKSE
ncbi:DUF885 domain-containing protein [Pseudoalteromonas citrea]|uniref:DUF885 domain-containing protein n=1 Tax=Pseudoalteromonas citrea TaxID=43655 RepID=A0A5S3XNT3_9GAMM|nr:DUF885 domain-containing protein [Pseudoalteromonas citrea]TMP42398.1 DUF885 domain-containing protein [Pseudoalteromonas citrea]TMP58783.1 DUF885 domain-containing protein [Pseudoalteromonas citrea]